MYFFEDQNRFAKSIFQSKSKKKHTMAAIAGLAQVALLHLVTAVTTQQGLELVARAVVVLQ